MKNLKSTKIAQKLLSVLALLLAAILLISCAEQSSQSAQSAQSAQSSQSVESGGVSAEPMNFSGETSGEPSEESAPGESSEPDVSEPEESSEPDNPAPDEPGDPEEPEPEDEFWKDAPEATIPAEPEESDTTLELVLTIPLDENAKVGYGYNPDSAGKDGIRVIDFGGSLIADADGCIYYSSLWANGGKVIDLTHDRVVIRLDDYDEDLWKTVLPFFCFDKDIHVMLSDYTLLIYHADTGEIEKSPVTETLHREKVTAPYSPVYAEGAYYWKTGDGFYMADGKKADDPPILRRKKDGTDDLVAWCGNVIRVPHETSKYYSLFSNGAMLSMGEYQTTVEGVDGKRFIIRSHGSYDREGNMTGRFYSVQTFYLNKDMECDLRLGDLHLDKLMDRSVTIGGTEFRHIVDTSIFRGEDGTQYALIGFTDRLEFYRINPGFDKRTMEEVRKEEIGESEVLEQFSVSAPTLASGNIKIHCSRAEVQSNAEEMRDLEWTFRESHYLNACAANTNSLGVLIRDPFDPPSATDPNINDDPITLPRYLKSTSGIQYGLKKGIPYCSGGINGLFINTFDSNINASNAISGNIRIRDNLYSGSVGLDCCGLISSAWKISHQSLSAIYSFASSSPNTSISDWEDLQRMDLIFFKETSASNPYHVAFFYEYIANLGEVYVLDCQGGRYENGQWCAEKVSFRKLTANELYDTIEKYHIDASSFNTHNYSWVSNSTSHWKKCSVCGVTTTSSAHTAGSTWYTDGTYHWKKCTVCGYIMNKTSHVYLGTWYYNGTYHWRKCKICGADGPKSTHVYAGSGLTCSTCGYVRPLSIFALPEKKQEYLDI